MTHSVQWDRRALDSTLLLLAFTPRDREAASVAGAASVAAVAVQSSGTAPAAVFLADRAVSGPAVRPSVDMGLVNSAIGRDCQAEPDLRAFGVPPAVAISRSEMSTLVRDDGGRGYVRGNGD